MLMNLLNHLDDVAVGAIASANSRVLDPKQS